MGKIVCGLVLTGVGLISFVANEIPVLLWGMLVAGVLLILDGVRSVRRARVVSKEVAGLTERSADLIGRLGQGQGVDRIAEEYHAEHGIPVARTHVYLTALLREFAVSDDPVLRQLAETAAGNQRVDSSRPAAECIAELSTDRTVLGIDETAKRDDGAAGTLVLSHAYLYFFANKPETFVGNAAKAGVDKLGELPYVFVAVAAYQLVSGVRSEVQDYFTPARVAELQERFALAKSFAIPLGAIAQVRSTSRKAKFLRHHFVEIRCRVDAGLPQTVYAIGTSSTSEESWASGWVDRVQLAAIGEGNLMREPVVATASRGD